MTDTVTNIEVYAEDIVHAIEDASREFGELCKDHDLIERIRGIMRQTGDPELRLLCEHLTESSRSPAK
jgi:hypothetical protein